MLFLRGYSIINLSVNGTERYGTVLEIRVLSVLQMNALAAANWMKEIGQRSDGTEAVFQDVFCLLWQSSPSKVIRCWRKRNTPLSGVFYSVFMIVLCL